MARFLNRFRYDLNFILVKLMNASFVVSFVRCGNKFICLQQMILLRLLAVPCEALNVHRSKPHVRTTEFKRLHFI